MTRLLPWSGPKGAAVAALPAAAVLVVTLPLRIVAGLIGLEDMGFAARTLTGPVWSGHAEGARAGPFRLGDVDLALAPLPLLLGQTRVVVHGSGEGGQAPLSGTLVGGLAGQGVSGLNGTLAVGRSLGGLPLTTLTFQEANIRFAGGRCAAAEGRVRAELAPFVALPGLAGGFAGPLRCDGGQLLMALAGPSGMERLDLHVDGHGRYRFTLGLLAADGLVADMLRIAGFRAAGDRYVVRGSGRL